VSPRRQPRCRARPGRVPRLAAGLAWLFAAGAAAESPAASPAPGAIETVVVTASHDPLPLESTPGSVDIISADALERARYDGLLEALRHRPGLHADQPAGRGSRGSVYVRGLDPNHSVVLLDGIALNDPTNARGGSFDFSSLDDLDALERVEIVRGPVSAVQGSDALAGAIQMISRSGKGPDRARLGMAGGRYGYFRGFAGASGERGPFDAAVAGSYVDEGQPADTGDYRGGTLLAALGLDLPRRARLRGTLLYRDDRSAAYPEFSGGPDLAVIRAFERRAARDVAGGLTFTQQPIDWLDTTLTGSLVRRREDRSSPGIAPDPADPFDPGIPAEPDSRDWLRRGALALRGTARAPRGIALSAGGDARWETGESRGALLPPLGAGRTDFTLQRRIAGTFVEARWRCACGVLLLAGARGDFPEGEGPELTPRVAGSADLPGLPLRVHASWGEGFKLPSFYALGNPLVGNAALTAERSRGWDTGLHAASASGRLAASATYFDLRVRNLIDFDVTSFRLENLGEVRSRGLELELEAALFEALALRGHTTYADTVDVETGQRLRNRPRWRGGFALDWEPVHSIALHLEALFVGRVLDASVPTGRGTVVALDAYARVDLALRWSPRAWLSLDLAVDNLLDAEYEEAIGFPATGIRPRAGFTLRL